VQKWHLRFKTIDISETKQSRAKVIIDCLYLLTYLVRVRPIDWWQIWRPIGWTLIFFSGEQNFSTRDISHTFWQSATKFGSARGLANRNLFPEVGPGVPWYHLATCIRPYWYSCKVVFRQLPIFANSSSVLSIHCVARGLGATFLYKCRMARWFPATAWPSCHLSQPALYIQYASQKASRYVILKHIENIPPSHRGFTLQETNTPCTRYNRLTTGCTTGCQPAASCKQTSNRLSNWCDNRLDVCLHDAAGCQTGLYNRLDNRFYQPAVYTIQPVDNWLYTRYSRLSNRLSNWFDNRLNVCIHDTTGCQTGLTTGLATGCIVYTNIQPAVKPVWQPVWQQVVSCKRGFSKRFACQPQCSIAAQQLQCCTKNRIWKGLQSESSLVSHTGLS